MGIIEQALGIREQKGLKKGRQERDNIFVENLIHLTDHDDKTITSLALVSVDFFTKSES